MKYVDEFRDAAVSRGLAARIARVATRPWTLMEVCGGQTHAIVKHGVDRLLPDGVELLHGPGCPVCVTDLETIDRAHAIAARPGVTFCSFGDMLRVPGSSGDLLRAKADGADVRVVYSPLDAVAIARRNPARQVVFFAIGFETTAPATATALVAAKRESLPNFSVLAAHVLVPPAIASILQAPGSRIQALLGPGHVCTVSGLSEYEAIARRFRIPIVVAGFEPVDLLRGVLIALEMLEAGAVGVENAYARAARATGNPAARAVVAEVYEACDRPWRGMGSIPKSGLRLRHEYHAFDACRRFDVATGPSRESAACIGGQVLRGLKRPTECAEFGRGCTPATPLGAPMVSSEGACAAYHAFRGGGA